MFESVRFGVGSEQIRVFVSYDREHDGDLHDRLVEQASKSTNGFDADVAPGIEVSPVIVVVEVIIICGEHTDCSERVGTELRIAREEERPYFLLWGRRELMCTKPKTAKPADAMYSWTWEILQSQILTIRRGAQSKESLAGLSPAKATPKS